MKSLDPHAFDYILIDEVHKAGASSYQRFMEYFQPDFYLGMTATPERSDNFNIYELFDYNIAYEIRLKEALEEKMLCPFIYYGVSDLSIDHQMVDDYSQFNQLTSDIRVQHIHEKIQYYKVEGVKTRGLIFCSSVQEAQEVSQKLNQLSYRTCALSGQDSQEKREQIILELEQGRLDYILTVDIFNEGVDIPSLNQIIMLRHTESAIIFIQQLGRGLRKHPKKEFVTIIDFIGNYKNNYLIPIALYGDRSFNKDNYQRKMTNQTQLSGLTTISFEQLAAEQIFDSIQTTNMHKMDIIKKNYLELEQRLGRPPLLYDFLAQNVMDPQVIFKNDSFKHYGQVINKFSSSKKFALNDLQECFLFFMTNELLNGKRPHEVLFISYLLENNGRASLNELKAYLNEKGADINPKILKSIKRILNYSFYSASDQEKYGQDFISFSDSACYFTHPELLLDDDFIELMQDIIKTSLKIAEDYPSGYTSSPFELNKKYGRKDACRLLCWDQNESSVIYGYRVKHNTCPIFVTYHKSEDISDSTKYKDGFINPKIFHWYSRSNQYIDSDDIQLILNHKEHHIVLPLFVKKEDTEGTDFYYLGDVDVIKESVQEDQLANGKPVVRFDLKIPQAVPYSIYHYLSQNK